MLEWAFWKYVCIHAEDSYRIYTQMITISSLGRVLQSTFFFVNFYIVFQSSNSFTLGKIKRFILQDSPLMWPPLGNLARWLPVRISHFSLWLTVTVSAIVRDHTEVVVATDRNLSLHLIHNCLFKNMPFLHQQHITAHFCSQTTQWGFAELAAVHSTLPITVYIL